jgi:hypothetical protein
VRTKLDEIVEEEIAQSAGSGKRIAERAFREGLAAYHKTAEWARKSLYENGRYEVVDYTEIQPEPVGENSPHKPWCEFTDFTQPYQLVGHHCTDRRKGERRKWLGAECNAGGIRLCVHSTDGALYFDRRIKDRRKA